MNCTLRYRFEKGSKYKWHTINIYFLLLLLYVHSYIQASYLHDRCRTKKKIKNRSNYHKILEFPFKQTFNIYIVEVNAYRNGKSFYIAVKDKNLVFRFWALSECTVKSRKSHRRKKTYSNFIQAKIMCCVLFFWAIRYSLCISFCISKRIELCPADRNATVKGRRQ